MSYLFSVLTMKHLGIKEEEFEKKLLDFLLKVVTVENVNPFYLVKERGKYGDNPHYNLVEKTNQRPDNRRRQLMKFYEKENWETQRNTIRSSKVSDLIGLIGEYLEKEENREILFEYNFLTEEIKNKVKKAKEQMPYPKPINKKRIPYEQAPDIIWDTIKFLGHSETTINRNEFIQAIKYLIKQNYEMKQVLNNITQIYIRLLVIAEDDDSALSQYIINKLENDLIPI